MVKKSIVDLAVAASAEEGLLFVVLMANVVLVIKEQHKKSKQRKLNGR